MRVERLLHHITQESFQHAGLELGDWSGNVWSVPCCVVGLAGPGDVTLPPERWGFILRKEQYGGIFWDPGSNAVYEVDVDAYNAMIELNRGVTEEETARRLGLSVDSVKELVQRLTAIRVQRHEGREK